MTDDKTNDYPMKLFNILTAIDNCRPSLVEGFNSIDTNSKKNNNDIIINNNKMKQDNNQLPKIPAKVLLDHIIAIRITSYRCRVLIFLKKIDGVQAEWNTALELYEDVLKPLLTTSFVLEGIDDLSIALLSYLGLNSYISNDEQNEIINKQIVEEMSLISSIKANIEYILGDYDSFRGSILNSNVQNTCIELNNIACTYMKEKKYQIAILYFRRALEQVEYADITKLPLLQNYSNEVNHNCGLSLLLIDQPKEAFICFNKIVNSFQYKPKFWIRMAECCIRYNMIKKEEENYRGGCSPVIQTIISKGRSRRLIVRCDSPYTDILEQDIDKRNNEILADMTLRKSIEYLHKALEIIDNASEILSNRRKDATEIPTWAIEKNYKAILPKEDNSHDIIQEHEKLRYFILMKLAYVYLCLKEPKLALDNSIKVINSTYASGDAKFLSRMYCVEALCLLGNFQEAIKLLEVDLRGEGLIESQIPPSWTTRTQPLSSDELSRLIYQVNYAASLSLLGKLDSAQKILELIIEKLPCFIPAFRGLIYVHLRKGNIRDAAKLLTECHLSI